MPSQGIWALRERSPDTIQHSLSLKRSLSSLFSPLFKAGALVRSWGGSNLTTSSYRNPLNLSPYPDAKYYPLPKFHFLFSGNGFGQSAYRLQSSAGCIARECLLPVPSWVRRRFQHKEGRGCVHLWSCRSGSCWF